MTDNHTVRAALADAIEAKISKSCGEFILASLEGKVVIAALRSTALRRLLLEARQYVSDAGCDEDCETQQHSTELLKEIDAALASSPLAGEG